MIKNERQYRITKSKAEQFEALLGDLERRERPQSIEPLMWKMQIDAVRSQHDELAEEISEYERLLNARPAYLEANSIDELPMLLIRARIALDLSQKELAIRMGLKEQQIQRYEATNYSTATLSRLKEVADAMGVRISESVYLPQETLTKNVLMQRLESLGIDYDFFSQRLLPSDLEDTFEDLPGDDNSVVVRDATSVLERVYGWSVDALCSSSDLYFPSEPLATARFKVPGGRQGRLLEAYVAYAHYLALVVGNSFRSRVVQQISADAGSVRHALMSASKKGAITFPLLLDYLWHQGIPVLPLSDAGSFHGACWRTNGRNVIVLKQRSNYASRWAFDLLHELHHAIQNPDAPSHGWVESDDLESLARTSLEEQAANLFAADVLLDGRAEQLIAMCVEQARKDVRRLKKAVVEVANKEMVGADHLANYLAYRLSLQGVNWWGAAANLQDESKSPLGIAREKFFNHFDFESINSIDARILRRALLTGEG